MINRIYSPALLMTAIICLLTNYAYARPSTEEAYKMISGHKSEYLLIMLPDSQKQAGFSHNGVNYTSSGLYHNDGSGTAIATYDFFSDRVYVSRDGQHLAVLLTQTKGFGTDLRFYHQDKLLRTYPLGRLASQDIALPIKTTKPMISNLNGDDQLLMQLPGGKLVLFDISTGEIIQYSNYLPERYHANIKTRDGKQNHFTNLHICERTDDEYSLLLSDTKQAHRLNIYPDTRLQLHKKENTLHTLARTSIHFKDIAGIRLRTNYQTQYIYWLVVLNNGDVMNFSTSKQALKMCAYDENQQITQFALQDLSAIKLIPEFAEE